MSFEPIPCDIFLSKDVKRILNNKYVVFIGDSVNRSMYKDMVKLYQKNEHLTDDQLKYKGELTFENDRLIEGGKLDTMSNDTTYKEVREFKTSHVLIRFYFVTRCNSSYFQNICEAIRNEREKPDVVIMNSCYWDLNRYGPNSVEQYKINLPICIQSLLNVLPKEAVFIWTAALPVSIDINGGFMGSPGTSNNDQKVRFRLRENTIEANRFAAQIANDFGVDFLDLHYYFRLHQFRRAYDGIHWDATAHRRISNLLLHHLCDCWDLATPCRFVVSVRRPLKAADNEKNVQQTVKQEENRSVQVEKEIKLIEAVKRNEDDDKTAVLNVVEDHKQKGDDGTKKKAETQTNLVAISDLSSPNLSTPSIENRLQKEKTKEPPKTSVNKTINNKKQRRCTNKRQFAGKVSNRNINNPDLFKPSASYHSSQSFINNSNSGFFSFMNTQAQNYYQDNSFTQAQNYYQDNSFNLNRTAYNFTDNMLNYNSDNFSSNQNPFPQTSYINNSECYYNNSNCNSFNSQMGNSYCSSNQSRYVSKYKIVNKRN